MLMVNPITLKIRTKKLGVLLKDARLAAGKNMKDCADVIGVSSRKIASFERGEKSPSLPELEVLAFYLEVPVMHFWRQDSLLINREERVAASNLKRLVSLRGRIVGAKLKQARTAVDMDLKELADSVGITTRRLKSYESGDNPIPLPELEGMAAHLNVPVEKFFDKEGVVGRRASQQSAVQGFLELPQEMQAFVTKPVNSPYLEIAKKLSGMSVEKLRTLAEGLLDITL
jgi:transcriptional regulator with XRE-family HTH domain